jgi:hypothetical protein
MGQGVPPSLCRGRRGFLLSVRHNMAPAKRVYEPRIFEGRVMLAEEQEEIYMRLLTSKHMESVTDSMRELILEEWPELAHKLPPKRPHG